MCITKFDGLASTSTGSSLNVQHLLPFLKLHTCPDVSVNAGQPVVVDEDTEIFLELETAVVLYDGTMLQAWELQPGHRVLAFEHVGRTMMLATIVKVEQGDSILIVLDHAEAAIFASAAAWTPQVLPRSLLTKIPEVDNQVMSVGSQFHGCAGHTCVPCTFHLTRGCRDGVTCGLCHFAHPEMSRSAKRNRIRKTGAGPPLVRMAEYFNHAAMECFEAICQRAKELKDDSVCSTDALDAERGSSSSMESIGDLSMELLPFQVKNTFVHVEPEKMSKQPLRRSRSMPHQLP
jgi:hypothetical protein